MPQKASYFGYNAPFLGGRQNVLTRQVDEQLIKNDIVQLVLTLPGERVHRPRFGTLLRAMVFELVDDNMLVSLSRNIQSAIEQNDERVRVNSVICTPEQDGLVVVVRIDLTPIYRPLTRYIIEINASQNGVRLVR